ncbi:MAG TPA: epoxyqueuosine reductase QueH [Candidatus Anaerobiospirillum stercoravium]|nr:epoxyqueuosine reductase QueH [Candidatus Anaerobiospirillum stercoravium]
MTLILPPDFGSTPKTKLVIPEGMTRLLVQVCCAPCCGAVLECFKVHGINPTLFFYNPNIHPRAEYEKRRDELIELAQLLGFAYVVPDYEPQGWFAQVKGLEHEPERGARCSVCFTQRLMATARYAQEHGFSHFTTTLATSRWKNKKQVDVAGLAAQAATGVPYWAEDWRKEGLVTRRYQLVKSFNFYNQLYCGCIFSRDNGAYTKDSPTTAGSPSPTTAATPAAPSPNASSHPACACGGGDAAATSPDPAKWG